MTSGTSSFRAIAVRYADRPMTLEQAYYRWSSYGEPDGPVKISYYFWLLEPVHARGAPPIVVDCGFDPAVWKRMGRAVGGTPAQAFAQMGIDGDAVERLVISHLHYDHIGNLRLFPNARISVPRIEFDFWGSDPVSHRPQFAHHTDLDAVALMRGAHRDGRVDLLDDGDEIAPGVRVRHIGGHSPGQIALEVAGEHGPIVLASDAVHFYDELDCDRPFAIFSDLADMYRGYDTLRELGRAGATIVPGHDPAVMERFAPLGGGAAGLAVCVSDDTGSV